MCLFFLSLLNSFASTSSQPLWIRGIKPLTPLVISWIGGPPTWSSGKRKPTALLLPCPLQSWVRECGQGLLRLLSGTRRSANSPELQMRSPQGGPGMCLPGSGSHRDGSGRSWRKWTLVSNSLKNTLSAPWDGVGGNQDWERPYFSSSQWKTLGRSRVPLLCLGPMPRGACWAGQVLQGSWSLPRAADNAQLGLGSVGGLLGWESR